MRITGKLIPLFVTVTLFVSYGITIPYAEDVLPLKIHHGTGYDDPKIKDACARIYNAAQNQARFLLSLVHPWDQDPFLKLLTDSKSDEHWIRPNTGTLAGLMFLYRFGPYDESIVGVSKDELLQSYILPMTRYLIATHNTGTRPTDDGQPWGDAWQSAHWAHTIARGSWWIWDALPQDVRDGVRRITAHEADRFVGKTPPTQIENDTKAEENAWNSQILSTAILLMPGDPRREAWEREFQHWAMSSFLRPDDEHSDTIVDGRSVASQFIGANIYNDFTLENHRIVHPDYMTTFTLLLGSKLDYVMTGRTAPEALTYNAQAVYENLKWFSLPDGGFVYPSGQDWGLFRNPDWLDAHLMMAVYLHDPDAWTLAQGCLKTLDLMQARSPEGAVYLPDEFFFASTQSDMLYSLAQSWLILHQSDTIPDNFQDKQGVLYLNAGKIILRRTAQAIHTVSWGKQIMAQCLPNRLDRIVSPQTRSGVGHILLGGEEKPLPLTLHSVKVDETENSFRIELEVDHGENAVRAHLCFESTPDGVWHWKEKLVALRDVTTQEIATGFIGILNNPHWIYERGERIVQTDSGKQAVIKALSDSTLQDSDAKRVCIDSILEIASEKKLHINYIGATENERGRITDRLYLNHENRKIDWKAGDTLSQFDIMIRCR